MYYSCCRTMVFGFNHANLFPERHLNKNIFSPVLAKCVSLHFQHNCVPLCASPPRSPPSPAANGCVGLCCAPVNLTHRVLLPRETQVNHLPHHTNGGNAEFPAVAADPNQATLFPSTRFPPITRADYRHSSSVFTMAVNMKGVGLSGGNQCQMEPLHALVHSHPLLNNDCLIPLSPRSRPARKTRSARECRSATSSSAPKITLLIFDSLVNM